MGEHVICSFCLLPEDGPGVAVMLGSPTGATICDKCLEAAMTACLAALRSRTPGSRLSAT